jgi:predicted oxidoreductase
MIYGLLRIVNSQDPFSLLDDVYFNKKISKFDTANCYCNSENIFGNWMLSRKIDRNDINIICKGGHHSNNGPNIIHRITQENIVYDLKESFKRLHITYADIFMFHRDDESVSPEKIYNICNYLLENKLCKKIGVSNWKTSRIEDVNKVSNIEKSISIIEESQIFLNYIKLSNLPYPNIHNINYEDYSWYMNHPEHKIQVYSVACFLNELDSNPIHQNKIFKKILEYISNITNESKQTILYVLLSKSNGMNIEVIQGSITCSHILTQSKIDNIYSIITEKIPLITEIIPCFLTEHPIGIPKNDIKSFLMNGVVGPFPLQNIQPENIDVITNWFLKKKLNDYHSMKHHQDNNNELKELCLNATIHDIVKEYIGYECICYNTEFFLRENNNDFAYTANWHIDPYIELDNKYPHFTLQIGFTDNTDNNSLSTILGSHLFDYEKKFDSIDKNNTFAPITNNDEKNINHELIYKLLNKKAQIYLFSNYLTHGRGIIQNNDNSIRLALTMRIISSKSVINTMKSHAHISKDIFILGSSTNEQTAICYNIFWNSIQDSFNSLFNYQTNNTITNNTITNNTITNNTITNNKHKLGKMFR